MCQTWAAQVAPLPLVVLFDEVDVLEGQAMVSFLRQLRGGFANRGVGKFPVSIALVGMRDPRDYIVHAKDGQLVRPGSPFNVKQDSATLGNFTRVQRVVETIITGDMDPDMFKGDDYRLTLDLGLVSTENGVTQIANPLYREVIARVLSEKYQLALPPPEFAWKKSDGTLNMDALLREFQDFWAQHSELWEAKADYTEAFPHLLLMAFLQRVINGGGRVEREYAAGRGRVDLSVQYGGAWNIIEIKLVQQRGREITIKQGLEQITRYRDKIDRGAPCYLVVFDRSPAGRQKTWEERLTWDLVAPSSEPGSATITVVGA